MRDFLPAPLRRASAFFVLLAAVGACRSTDRWACGNEVTPLSPCPIGDPWQTAQGTPAVVWEAARTGPIGGESLEELYVITLPECLHAARSAYAELKVSLTRQESYALWAAVDGRLGDSTPVRIKGSQVGEMRTYVLFTVGTQRSEANWAFVRTLKQVFEERLRLARAHAD